MFAYEAKRALDRLIHGQIVKQNAMQAEDPEEAQDDEHDKQHAVSTRQKLTQGQKRDLESTENNISVAKSRMLDRRILALAQADSGSGKITAELQRLALRARDLAQSTAPRRRGLFGGLFGTAEKRPANISDMLREMDGIVSSLMGSAEVLRQNNVALDGYESDIMTENTQVLAEIQRAGEFHSALVVDSRSETRP